MTFSGLGFLLAITPLLILLALLVSDRYPGERVIDRLRRLVDAFFAEHSRPRRPAPGRSSSAVPARGGRLIACSLAGRGPPVPA